MPQNPVIHNTFAAILAGGSGSRMGSADKPKQYMMLGEKPVFVHTVEKFVATGAFDAVLVMCPDLLRQQTTDLLLKYAPACAPYVVVCAGGATRNDTVCAAIAEVEARWITDDDTLLVTHDAVRPFVDHRIILENLEAAARVGACDTVIPATDTIVESLDGDVISSIPPRQALYQGQTPQSFRLNLLKRCLEALTQEERDSLTDACKAVVLADEPVALVAGDAANMKITYPHDLRIARALMEDQRA
ncbi:2-C-methyl-D-erythritol 4-phosphate cytidylyltransferase [Eggerthellaceae bacterium 3-80]|nr:2-C-methyl-D-erythritol 4-phosphate cytidylyltransferase [bacterium D16-34]